MNAQVAKGRGSAELHRKLERLKKAGNDETKIIEEVQTYIAQKQHDRAEELLQGFLEQVESVRVRDRLEDIRNFQKKTAELYQKGRAYQDRKKYDKAYRVFKQVLVRDPRHAGATAKLKTLEENGVDIEKSRKSLYIAIGAIALVLLVLFVILTPGFARTDQRCFRKHGRYIF